MSDAELTSLDRVLWPRTGTTKRDLVEWYRAVAPAILPHLRGRPLTLWRFPQGVEGRGFWQNECRGAPGWLGTAELRGQRFCVANDEQSLVWLANLSAIELHPFPLRADEPERPLEVVVDLDPGPPATLAECCRVALYARELLAADGLDPLPKTSGRAGLHLLARPPAGATFARTKALVRELASRLAEELPDLVVDTPQRRLRRGRVLVDWLQNDPTRSTVAPYSLRGTPLPAVSTPVTWEEVERCAGRGRPEELAFGPQHVLERLERLGDLLAPLREAQRVETKG
jgi:bifunctional non-homologous end joining protein LigD